MDPERRERERLKRLSRLTVNANSSGNNTRAIPLERQSSSKTQNDPKHAVVPPQSPVVNDATSKIETKSDIITKPTSAIPLTDSKLRPFAKSLNTEASLEQWTETTLSDLFSISLDPLLDQYFYLSDLHIELTSELEERGSTDAPVLNLDNLDRAIFSRLNSDMTEAPFNYLLGTYRKADDILRTIKKGPFAEEKLEVMQEVRRLCVSYAGLSVLMPEMLETMHSLPDIVPKLLLDDQESYGIPPSFLTDLVAKFTEEGTMADFFEPIFTELSKSALSVSITENFYRQFTALRRLLSHKEIALTFITLPAFNPDPVTPPELESRSLLGPFFRMSAINGKVAEQTFGNIDSANNIAISNGISSIRTTIPVVQSQLFDICNSLVRHSMETRSALLQYFANALNLNKKRHAIQVDAAAVSSDGFMLNITSVLNQFADPFISDPLKISKIDIDYLRRAPLINLEGETRLAADENATKEYYSHVADGENNFISHIFFLNVAYHHYGLGATMSTHQKIMEKIRDMQKYKDQMQAEQPYTGPQAMMMTMQYQRVEKALKQSKNIAFCYEAVLCNETTQSNSFSFLSLVATWLVRLVDAQHAYPQTMISLPLPTLDSADSYRNLPEYFVEDIAEFFLYVSRMMPKLLTRTEVSSLVVFSLVFLRNSAYIKNPYLKAKLVEILFNGVRPQRQGDTQGALGPMLNSHPLALTHLFPALMGFYIEVESTGLSSQFYDKFNIRFHISQIFKAIWDNPVHREKLELQSKNDIEFFVRFVALLLNDQTYLLDEALAKLSEIHGLQHELRSAADPTTQEHREREGHLQQSERAATSYLQLGTETLSMLNLFTASIPAAFCTPEIVDRLAAMLDYNVEALVGPKCTDLKVQNPEKYHFDPKALLNGIVGIFLNMAPHNTFVVSVARDGRSYKKDHFDRTVSILRKFALRSSNDIDALTAFINNVEVRKTEYEQDEEDLGDDIPDEFLDPLMGELMRDPVILPTSKTVIDRSTIKRHLLNDATDPFNRAPLSISDVVPDEDLQRRIEEFRASKKKKQKQ